MSGLIRGNELKESPKVEHSCWTVDWTSWDYTIPEGVDKINIFVGQIYIDQNGKPAVGGFGTLDPSKSPGKLDDFIKACKDKGIEVKVSIGGHGGQYDSCWSVLKKGNIQDFANTLSDFCTKHGLCGVDFDFEEYSSVDPVLVGQLIKEFKTLSPDLEASLCTNAGFEKWKGVVGEILDATVDEDGKSLLDRLYVMSYYDSLDKEEGWLTQWAGWGKEKYGLSPSQISVGLDDTDAHANDIEKFSEWAASQGFSTAYWEWNPATKDSSNASTSKIITHYNKRRAKSKRFRGAAMNMKG